MRKRVKSLAERNDPTILVLLAVVVVVVIVVVGGGGAAIEGASLRANGL